MKITNKKKIQIFIYYFVEMTPITFITTSICNLFVINLVVVLAFIFTNQTQAICEKM